MAFRLVTSCLVLPIVFVVMSEYVYSYEKTSYHACVTEVVDYLKSEKVKLSESRMKAIARHVLFESRRQGVDYRLVLALMKVESNFRQDAISCKGARGLLQIRPVLGRSVAKDAGVHLRRDEDLHEPEKNIRIGIYHLSKLIRSFDTVPSALYAYNRGTTKARANKAKNVTPNPRFASAVLKEYANILTVLPPH